MKAVIRLLIPVFAMSFAMANDFGNTSAFKDLSGQKPDTSPPLTSGDRDTKPTKPGEKTANDLTDPKSTQSGLTSSGQSLLNSSAPTASPTQQLQQTTEPPRLNDISPANTRGNPAIWNWPNGDPDLGFHLQPELPTGGLNNDVFNYMHDEFRLLIGEEVYAKMAWTYFDLKELDDWIYSTTSQLNFGKNQIFAPYSAIVGLDEHLQVGMVLGSKQEEWWTFQSGNTSFDLHSGSSERLLAEQRLIMTDEQLEESLLFKLMKFLTIKNLLFSLLSMLALVFVAKMFKFFVRQQ